MSVHDGKKAARSLFAFNDTAAAPGEEGPIARIAKTLQKRPLGEKHFAQAKDYLDRIHAAAEIKIMDNYNYNPQSSLADRRLELALAYMGIVKNEDGEALYDQYAPTLLDAKIQQNVLSYTQRPMPVVFSSQHTEYRFIQRTSEPLKYDSDEFIYTLSSALTMATAIAPIMHKAGRRQVPIALPDTEGLYLGSAIITDKGEFDPIECVIAVANAGSKNGPVLHGLADDKRIITQAHWEPRSYLKIQTFIAKRDFKIANAFTSMINSYANCLPPTPEVQRDLNYLIQGFSDIIDSDLWDKVNKYGESYLPDYDAF